MAIARGYTVNANGQVMSRFGKVRKLRVRESRREHYYTFTVNVDGFSWPIPVHRLVAFQKFGDAAFAEGVVTRHLNGDSLDNSMRNIELGTPKDNALDRPPLDRKLHAAKGNQQRSAEWVELLRKDYASGMSYRQLMAKHNVAKSTLSYYLSKAAKRRTFTHAPKI